MKISTISNFEDFKKEIGIVGFCLSGSNGEGIFSLEGYYSDQIEFHTGNLELDPWEWRHRAVEETSDIYYGKVFYNKSGWITHDWLLDFINVRRQGKSIDDLYTDGLLSKMDKSIYDYIKSRNKVSLIDIQAQFGKENKSKIVKSLVNLQMKILITVCGEIRKISKTGMPFGWPVTVYGTVEERNSILKEHDGEQDVNMSYSRISDHIKKLNPMANEKKIASFIKKGY